MPLFGPFAQPGGLLGRRFSRDDFLNPEDLLAYRDFLRRAGGPRPFGGGTPPPPPDEGWRPSDRWPGDPLYGPKGGSGGVPPPPSDKGWRPSDRWPGDPLYGPKGGTGAPPPPPGFPLLGAPTTVRRQLFGPLANLPPLR